MKARVLVSIVTYNSASCLKTCLESLAAQTYRDFSVSIWDNASSDETPSIIEDYRSNLGYVHLSDKNLGFCAAHNRLIALNSSEYVLVLNPDIVLEKLFLEIMIPNMDLDSTAGSATGKLLRWQTQPADLESFIDRQHAGPKILDTAGIYLTPSQRHLDRGSGETDSGNYDRSEYVFGASGAAALYRRAMLEDVAEGDRYFDENFFSYREDADLAWRAQWMGWRCLYVPEAVGHHARRVLPEGRSKLPDAINLHSFKNRYLLRIKNMDFGTYVRFFIPITIRDAGILAYVLIVERSSLPGIPLLIRAFSEAWAMRKSLRARRRVSPCEIRSWFSYSPVAKPRP